MIEFFWTPSKSRLMVHDLATDQVEAFGNSHRGLATRIDQKVRETYPQAHRSLCNLYGSEDGSMFPRAHRFLKCNFSLHDNRPDIDDDLNFELEIVPCPLRGECKAGICQPVIASILSPREIEVIRLHVEGLSQAEIGERLFISERTVHNHFTNIYSKLRFTGQACPDHLLISYAYKNHLV